MLPAFPAKRINIAKKTQNHTILCFWRRHPESDRGIADLQSAALPLGYGAVSSRGSCFQIGVHSVNPCLKTCGAAYEARTRYLHLGKVALYQMS